MAPPPANPLPPEPTPAVVVTLRLYLPEPRDRRPAAPRRPPRELPPVSDWQRWLDLSG